jgi:hypothetical protein
MLPIAVSAAAEISLLLEQRDAARASRPERAPLAPP